MKKYLLLLVSLCFCGISFSEERLSDISIYQDISQLYENEYYPGAIEKVDLLEDLYPESVFLGPSLFIKARSLINLNYYEEAKITLQNTIIHMHTGKAGFAQCNYLLGVANFYLGLYEEALKSFYLTCKLSLINDEEEYYDSSIYYAAESYYILKDYEKAYPLYEYVIENGERFEKGEYIYCSLRLIDCYNKTNNYDKTLSLYDSLIKEASLKENSDNSYFTSDTINLLSLYAAEASERKGEYDKSYKLYSRVIQGGEENLAVIALKNAYLLSEKGLIDVSIGELFSRVSESFNNKTIVDDFWIRLGIDEYNNHNFDKASTYFSNVKDESKKDIINIYKAKMTLDSDNTVKGAEKTEEILSLVSLPKDDEEDKLNISDTYYSLLLQCNVQKSEWDKVPKTFKKIKNPSDKDIYNNSLYYYRNKEYKKVDSSTGVLYASSLSKREMYKEASEEYEKLEKENRLPKEYYSEWSKALFYEEEYEKSYEKILLSDDLQKDYIAGLCKINLKDLDGAREYFNSYIRKMSNNDHFNVLALYYKGYIEYTNSEYKNAYNTFIRFILEANNDYIPYIRSSHYYASLSALQNKDYDNAALQASYYVDLSLNYEDKIKATIFNFEILNDGEKYNEAIALLLPYTKEKNSFTPKALFMVADVYAKIGEIEIADKTYQEIYTSFPQSSLAEEAMYKCGEVYYFGKIYDTAYNRFKDYIYKYPDGEFLDAALYFSGEGAYKLSIKDKNNINEDLLNKAIMNNKTMLMKMPESIYAYGAYKTLLSSYYELKDYEQALNTAYIIMEKFPEQASQDNIGTKIKELEQIASGTDHRIAEKLSLYEQNGKSSTLEGRKLGSEIVMLYGENSFTQDLAYEMGKEIVSNIKSEEEYPYMAGVVEFLGDYSRKSLLNKEAADYYLLAATYYRSSNNTSKAASVLYAAAESFVAAGQKGDAQQVANLLKELYPETNYATLVEKIVR